jgi:hypothetical protein
VRPASICTCICIQTLWPLYFAPCQQYREPPVEQGVVTPTASLWLLCSTSTHRCIPPHRLGAAQAACAAQCCLCCHHPCYQNSLSAGLLVGLR